MRSRLRYTAATIGRSSGLRGFFLDERCQRDELTDTQAACGGRLSNVRGQRLLEARDHARGELFGGGSAGQRVGVGKQIALEVVRGRIEGANQVRLRCRSDEGGLRTKATLLEDRRHLSQRQPLAERHRTKKDIAARDLVDDGGRRHGGIEAVLASLEAPPGTAHPHRNTKRRRVRHDSRVGQHAPHRLCVTTLRNLDERLGVGVSLVGFRHEEIDPDGRGHPNDRDQRDRGQQQPLHDRVSSWVMRALARLSRKS